MTETTPEHGEAALRDEFDAEVRVAGLDVSGGDRERLYDMWAGFLHQREALRHAAPTPEQEPIFLEKPAALPGRPS